MLCGLQNMVYGVQIMVYDIAALFRLAEEGFWDKYKDVAKFATFRTDR